MCGAGARVRGWFGQSARPARAAGDRGCSVTFLPHLRTTRGPANRRMRGYSIKSGNLVMLRCGTLTYRQSPFGGSDWCTSYRLPTPRGLALPVAGETGVSRSWDLPAGRARLPQGRFVKSTKGFLPDMRSGPGSSQRKPRGEKPRRLEAGPQKRPWLSHRNRLNSFRGVRAS